MSASLCFINFCLRKHINLLKLGPILRCSARQIATDSIDEDDEDPGYKQDRIRFEQRLQQVRDSSGLNKVQKRKVNQQMPDLSKLPKNKSKERSIQRRLYALHGHASGINPSIMWPSKAELDDRIEIEREWTTPFHETIQQIKDRKEAEIRNTELRDEKIRNAMDKMDDMIKQYKTKQIKAAADEQTNTLFKNQELLDEFREAYGFSTTVGAGKFKMFRSKRMQEIREEKKAAIRLTRKEKQKQDFQKMVEKGSGVKY